ncbi:aminotransferase class I/II-fold pyridoxal phosphate-dependent enzyme (plasmid) [Peteryoungia desertarenae]|uniref:Aminotransferase class I/II-fold pyridoxal phosphate-dependent enzyme n=1 Tax=Peteryoungia desertarenae TaxID=1813451 RepID=A0ABX6QTB6_9HYPH|nr:aminotransferase class I/II-fold pyridoxal phosphate-dependent enzyme [Peteryoungia desertarenae]QLF71724.1 aminotransferase class I/II-fold pyridoxal phosphate-dependent enzyme [Peteryoungia desertarenae]
MTTTNQPSTSPHVVSEREPSSTRYRNTATMIAEAGPSFVAAGYHGIMALYARPMAGRQVHLVSENRDIVDFVRCSYLGLDNHEIVVAAAEQELHNAGTLHWSCARTRLNFSILGDLEDNLSDLFQARVLTFTTVLAANMSALPLLASGHLTNGQKPLVVFDRLAHATLAYHKAVLAAETEIATIPHNDMDALEALCRSHACVAYVCDGVYSMGGHAPLLNLADLQQRYGLFLYVDDAHGISILGNQGSGFARSVFSDLGDRTIIAASLGKGFGASGGILMLGTAAQELLFRRFAIAHAFSASLNTAAIGAARGSAVIHRMPALRRLQMTLRENLALLDRLLPTRNADDVLPIRTIPIGDELQSVAIARQLLTLGFYTSAIFFPTVARGAAGLRICVTASHTEQQIRELCQAIARTLEELREGYR